MTCTLVPQGREDDDTLMGGLVAALEADRQGYRAGLALAVWGES